MWSWASDVSVRSIGASPPLPSRAEMTTTRARCERDVRTREARRGQSSSVRRGSTSVRCSASAVMSTGPLLPRTWARIASSMARTSTRSPAREARAASSRVASIWASRRGASPSRAADNRPESMTMRTRRSRSGRQVRTRTSPRRAVERQSMDRTSSPTTYSRKESNSVPSPRTISRSRARREGR